VVRVCAAGPPDLPVGLVRYHAYMLHDYLDLAFNSTLRRPGADLRPLRLEVRAAQHRYAHPG
jgi:hypothetical protein